MESGERPNRGDPPPPWLKLEGQVGVSRQREGRAIWTSGSTTHGDLRPIKHGRSNGAGMGCGLARGEFQAELAIQGSGVRTLALGTTSAVCQQAGIGHNKRFQQKGLGAAHARATAVSLHNSGQAMVAS